MADSRGLAGSSSDNTSSSGAGTITRIRLENFMCHSNLQIELCPWVNFITGQNGSGKSAILTALCVVFGCRAKGTQRAATLKDFIKTDCSYALVEVEMKNEGDDAFKREIFGDAIIIERRINESGSSTVIKDHRGRKVANRKEELREIIEHFNIDVENPCVVMSQDKSREFLHSGSEKDKFKFFYKATLLQQVDDLLQSIHEQLISANALVDELEALIKPIEKELAELQLKIKNMEELEELSQHVQLLKKKLAWSWVYDVDRQLQEQSATITKLKERIPICQVKIDSALNKMESLRDRLTKKKVQIECMTEKTSEVRRKQDELQHSISKATKEKLELEEEYGRYANQIQAMVKRVRLLEQQIQDVQEQNIKDTQAEESELEEKQKELQLLIDAANSKVLRLVEEESILSEMVSKATNEIRNINEEIEDYEKKEHDIRRAIRELQRHQTNKVTAFGGERVISLLRSIERHHQQFKMPPIGPIGAHVNLAKGDSWGPAVENAIGKLLNAFIVTEHRDALLLRKCAKEANYTNLQIIIYDFSRPRLNIPSHMLPQTKHPTALSLIRSDNNTVLNVLVDMGNAERQVLVEDYEVGKSVAFDRSISNVKEVYTLDGYKMFSRGSVQTVLPPRENFRTSRLCSSYDNQIKNLQLDASTIERGAEKSRKRKRDSEAHLNDLQVELRTLKARRTGADRDLASKRLALQDLKKSYAIETTSSAPSTINELHCEISKMQEEIREKEILMETLRVNIDEAEAKAEDLKLSFENLCESAREEINAFEKAEAEVMKIDQDLKSAEAETAHYQSVMTNKVLHDIEVAEAQYQELEENRKESGRKASIICPESDIEALGDWDRSTPEQLSAKLNKMNQRLQQESRRYSDSIDDLRLLYETKEKKISRKRHTYKSFREKLRACQDALDSRWSRFSQSRCYMKAELTRKFNGHLARKGVSGHCKVDYEKKTLTVEVKLPQDASRGNVRDTRGLSGGERSFSTLCFALALHQMIEAPFRAMDEFDVFMDAVSRKISLDTLVDFAVQQGSQWIFITPHDISLVKQGEKIKKQQMAAPRS